MKQVALLGHAQRRYFLCDLARNLKDRYHCAVHLFCGSPEQAKFYRNQDRGALFASVTVSAPVLDFLSSPLPDEAGVMATARAYETRFGISINCFAVGQRHLGRGYALLGPHHSRSRYSEGVGYAQMVHAYNQAFTFWETALTERHIDLVIGGAKEVAAVSRALGIAWRTLAAARYKNFYYWANDEFYSHAALPQRFRALRDCPVGQAESLTQPYRAHTAYRDRFLKRDGIRHLLFDLGLRVAKQVYWRVRGFRKGRGYFLRDDLRQIARNWYDHKKLTDGSLAKLKDLEGVKFVFYALQTEPETSLGVLSPEFFFQHAVIAAVSRDLPAGVRLVVKENYFALGRRPRDFYDQIRDLKNVIMMDIGEPGIDVARAARAVVTINGTIGMEAAILGKPVIVFGRHNIFDCLPHVRLATDIGDLRDLIAWALDDSFDAGSAIADGARYLQAVEDTCFDMGRYDHLNLRNYDPITPAKACDALMDSLSDDAEREALPSIA